MGVAITIRDVPEDVRDELAARAEAEGKSMQQYLRHLLISHTQRRSQQQLFDEIAMRRREWNVQLPRDWVVNVLREERDA